MRDRGGGCRFEATANLVSIKEEQMIRLMTQRTIAAVMVASAILVPAASAQASAGPALSVVPPKAQATQAPETQAAQQPRTVPLGVERTASGANPAAQSAATSAPSSASASSGGFDWGDAGIGAAAMLIFVSLGAGTVVALRRTRDRGQPALTA